MALSSSNLVVGVFGRTCFGNKLVHFGLLVAGLGKAAKASSAASAVINKKTPWCVILWNVFFIFIGVPSTV